MDALDSQIYDTVRLCEFNEELFRRPGLASFWHFAIFAGAVASVYLSHDRLGVRASNAESLAARWTMLRGEAVQLEVERKTGLVPDDQARARVLRITSHFAALDQEDLQPEDTKEARKVQNMIEVRQGLEPRG